MAAPVFAWAEAEVQTPPAAVQMPPAEVQTPPATVQTPPAAVQTPPAAVQTPPAAVQTPPAAVQAPAPTPQVANTAATGMGGQLLQLLFGLLLVIGLIFVLAWVMRRVQRVGPNSGQLIELLGSRALGPRDRLMLVQVGNEQILLGITPGRITPLHVLKEPVQVPVREQVTPDFAQHLLKLMGKDKDKK